MVKSVINPKINYNESRKIDRDDNELEGITYDIAFDEINPNKELTVIFGNPKYTYIEEGIIYFPTYLVVDDDIKSKIGVIEIHAEDFTSFFDEDNDIDSDKINTPLLFGFINEKFIQSFESENVLLDNVIDLDMDTLQKDFDNYNKNVSNKKDKNEKNDVFEVIPPKNSNISIVHEENEKSVFKKDIHIRQPPVLTEETKKDTEELKNNFQESPSNYWIENYMSNNNYSIIENEGSGDCFFAVVRDAFSQIGEITTVDKLRELLSKEADDETFQNYRRIYLDFENQAEETQKEIEQLEKSNRDLKNRTKTVDSKREHETLVNLWKSNKEKISKLKEELSITKEYIRYDFGYMKNIDTLEKFKNYIMTSSYWVDAWGISVIEHKLNIKMIIMSEEYYESGSLDNVLNCGDTVKKITDLGTFSPNYYIMTSYTGKHYELISYKKKNILKYNEIPYDIKMLILNKCLEKNSGTFYLIQDFRNLKSRMGISPEEGKPDDFETEDILQGSLYNNNTNFVFYNKSNEKPKPGKGTGEKIANEKIAYFINLSKIKDWRKKLDDNWEAPFHLDGKRWNSVEHYYQASKYKKGFPNFYEKFSLDDLNSSFNKKALDAREAGGKNRSEFREPNIKIDGDFYGERSRNVKIDAVRAKFTQNKDLTELLKLTYPAKLSEYKKGSPPEEHEALMMVRRELLTENTKK